MKKRKGPARKKKTAAGALLESLADQSEPSGNEELNWDELAGDWNQGGSYGYSSSESETGLANNTRTQLDKEDLTGSEKKATGEGQQADAATKLPTTRSKGARSGTHTSSGTKEGQQADAATKLPTTRSKGARSQGRIQG
ncbi:uncharacterized protein LOC135342062 isoform X2 [Halichondria panicea]|uniref:uncharacterized protein LOC135342062 isoform X2 n=1 Tax=Halichondria panicea TaxID=6063 RepID=UPI00312B4AE8